MRRLLAVLLLAFAATGCDEPSPSQREQPARETPRDVSTEARIGRVERGLILLREDESIAWDESGTMAERMAHYDIPGVGVAVIDDFEIAWARGWGVLEAGGNDPVTAETLFHAGSIAKTVSDLSG